MSASPSPVRGEGNLRVWDLATGKELHRLSHEDSVYAVSFSPDGKTFVSGSADKTVRLWLWQPQDLMDAACERSTRNLSWDEWRLYFDDLAYSKTCAHLPVHESVIDHAQQLAKSGNREEAIALFEHIADIEPTTKLDPIAETESWERKGKLDKLQAEKQYAAWIIMASETAQLDPTAVPNKDWKGVDPPLRLESMS